MTDSIRDATPADLDQVVEFNLRLAEESEGRSLDPERLRGGVSALLSDAGKGRYFLLERNGSVVGQTMITFEWSDWRNGVFWWIQSVYVHAEHRGTGAFSALYRHIRDKALNEKDVCGIRLYVDKTNQHAADIYRALGMQDAHYDMLEIDFQAPPAG